MYGRQKRWRESGGLYLKNSNKTKDKIKYAAFKLFLEKGYEATNIRDICEEVEIKASSLYFHYESKQELFFCLYDEICRENLKYLEKHIQIDNHTTTNYKLYNLYRQMIEYYVQDIVKQKFLLRYHLFPPAEVSNNLREKFKYWTNEENNIILNILKQSLDNNNDKTLNDYLQEYKRFVNFQLTEIIIFNIKLNDDELDKQWLKFWNNSMLNGFN